MGEIAAEQKQDSRPGSPILIDLADDIQNLLKINEEGLKTMEVELQVSRHKEPQRESKKLSNGDGTIQATQCGHNKVLSKSCTNHQERAVKSILKNSRPFATSQASLRRTFLGKSSSGWCGYRNRRRQRG